MARIENILIVGGGTSGWLSAAYLAKKLGTGRPGGVKITLIESSEIGTIGVGEATIPPIRSMVAALGLDEAHFMRESSATFKLAIRFDNWLHSPAEGNGSDDAHRYYHAFGNFALVGHETMSPYWVLKGNDFEQNFVDYTMMEGLICDAGRGPKRIIDPQFSGPVQYAYHFDAGRLSKLLKTEAGTAGVEHLVGTVTKVEVGDDGAITGLVTEEHGTLTADLYVDCTGFSAHLIEKALGVEFKSLSDILFCDQAIACQVPYEDEKQAIPPYTISTAHENGWTWDIPLNDRRGVGYVFSSKYTDSGRAEEILAAYVGDGFKDVKSWHLKMRIGSRRQQWYKNCVAIGLSAGFVEPLESTGIYLVDIALRWLVDYLPPVESMPLAANQFNASMNACYEDIVDFIKLHYCLSQRTDTDFWIDNQRESTLPTTLKDRLDSWRYRVPSIYEFTNQPNVFGLTNYLQVLYGMDRLPDLSGQEDRFLLGEAADQRSLDLRAAGQGGINVLPDHRALIDEIYANGFQVAPNQARR